MSVWFLVTLNAVVCEVSYNPDVQGVDLASATTLNRYRADLGVQKM